MPLFVVQRHSARRLHYDLRLERDGVLASWALPKGLPREPGVRRLAVHVEDHPLEYAAFEGEIPAGQYGAGHVEIYDGGSYELVEERRRGGLTVRLEGRRLRGTWTIAPDRGREREDDWLIVRRSDDEPPPRRVSYQPMLATLADDVPTGRGWSYEVKWDGFRAVARLDAGEPLLWSRRGQHLTERFEAVAKALPRGLRTFDAVVDGEVCALDAQGRPSFQLLQQGRGTLVYFVFDVLEVDREPTLRLPLSERRELLRGLVDPASETLRISEAFDDGRALLAAAREQGLEGVVAKQVGSRYRPGERTRQWLKVKARRREELLVAGWVEGDRSRKRLGSLVLARRAERGLEYAGQVGAGLTEPAIDEALAALEPLRRARTPFRRLPDDPRLRGKRVHWVEPEVAVEVELAEWTEHGHARLPAFKGLRRARPAEREVRRGRRSVRLTRLDRPLFREEGITRGDLVDYYRSVAPALLSHLRGRPFTIKRYYTVVGGPCVWEKDAPEGMPSWIRTCPLEARSRAGEAKTTVDYPVVDDELALLWMLDYGCVDLHVWTSRCDRPERPDHVLFDLDPAGGAGFPETAAAARLLREALEALELESFVKTSGGAGLHVLVPIARRHDHGETRRFASLVALALARAAPELVTTERSPARRQGVFVDAKLNGRGMTVVSAYSVRPRPGAPVSTPLRWDELTDELDPLALTTATVPGRVARDGDPLAPALRLRQRLDRALAAARALTRGTPAR